MRLPGHAQCCVVRRVHVRLHPRVCTSAMASRRRLSAMASKGITSAHATEKGQATEEETSAATCDDLQFVSARLLAKEGPPIPTKEVVSKRHSQTRNLLSFDNSRGTIWNLTMVRSYQQIYVKQWRRSIIQRLC